MLAVEHGVHPKLVYQQYFFFSRSEGQGDLFNSIASLAAVITIVITLTIFFYNRWKVQRIQDEKYVAVWGAALAELQDALDRMKGVTERFKEQGDIMLLEIFIVDGLLFEYLKVSRHPQIAQKMLKVYRGVTHFRDSYRNGNIGAAIWVCQHRQKDLVIDFRDCNEKLKKFCENRCIKIETPDVPDAPELAPKWQLSEKSTADDVLFGKDPSTKPPISK